jgi:hypothetical protein
MKINNQQCTFLVLSVSLNYKRMVQAQDTKRDFYDSES